MLSLIGWCFVDVEGSLRPLLRLAGGCWLGTGDAV